MKLCRSVGVEGEICCGAGDIKQLFGHLFKVPYSVLNMKLLVLTVSHFPLCQTTGGRSVVVEGEMCCSAGDIKHVFGNFFKVPYSVLIVKLLVLTVSDHCRQDWRTDVGNVL